MANVGIPLLALEPMSYCRVKQYYIWKKENGKGQNMSDRKFIDEVVKAHNEYRSRHQAPSLSHSKDLSSTAQKWADHLALTNTFQHSNASLKGEPLGENIAMKWSSRPDAYTGQEVTDQWYSEVKMHAFGGEPRSLSSGHFTQVVWKGSKEVGVGKAQTRDGKIIVVANYRPAGNMMGDYARNVLPPKDGKIVIKEKAPDTKPASGFSDGGRHVATHDSGGPFKTRFEDMRRDFFKDSSFSSQPTQSSGGFRKSESRSVRTFTVTEGAGPKKVTKKVTEETIIKPDGEKIVNRKEEVTSGGSSSSYGGSGAMAGDPFRDFDSKLRIGRSPFKGSSPQGKKKGRSKSSSSSDSSQERKPKKPEKMSDFIDGVVKAHNKVRDKHGASKLKHSKELSGHAQKWAEHLASTGSFQHSQCMLNGERIGENIACKWSTGGGDYSSQEVCDQWYSEITKHDFRSDRSMGSGHFTQMVWKGSKELGVGKAKGQGGKVIVVANYRPPGNVIGQYRDNVLPKK
ncbi:uncharacterized protein [Haliotis cracherodii]|uniref:uncharacterized protein isoform X1 n=2 Tax=Haliotis cracherodii TaxID=6455 RepID=UPI0039EC6353